jgi:hypothetical protein
MGAAQPQLRAAFRLKHAFWLLLASLAASSVVGAAIPTRLEEAPNAVCSFVSRARAEQPQQFNQSECPSTVKCLINELGNPTTGEEM